MFLPILAAINGENMIHTLIYLIVIGVIFGLLWWLIDYCGLPAPFAKVCKVILAIFAVLIVINILLGLVNIHIVSW